MRYDDRLGTVLRHKPGGATAAKTQFRQLLDLLGTLPSEARSEAVDAAYLRLAELGKAVSPDELRTMLADPGLRLRSPRLLALLAAGAPAVAATAITRAQLNDQEWLDLIPALPVPARGLLRLRSDLSPEVRGLLDALGIHARALPPVDGIVTSTVIEDGGSQGIAALVRRIEAFRKTRAPAEAANDRSQAPRLPLGEEAFVRAPRELRAFDFSCDAEGRITWADPGVAPMAVGLSLPGVGGPGAAALARAFRQLQPLRAVRLALDGAPAIVGEWQVDAAPWFEAQGGRLAGWRGRFRRVPTTAAHVAAGPASEADRLRQLLHELRTPVNAIQGYAEAMQQSYFGPIGHEYRAMSASIAADAARILAGFEELERLARLDSGAIVLEAGECDFAEVLAATIRRLEPHTAARQSGFELQTDAAPALVPLARIEAERLVWRLLATLAAAAAPAEPLHLKLRVRDGEIRLKLELPAALGARSDDELFRASGTNAITALSPGNFGGGFALRLAAAEARAAGGSLQRRGDKLRLVLAGLTQNAMIHSQGRPEVGSQTASSN